MKDILQSYSGKELRRFVIEHNKKVKAKVRLEVKEIKDRILKKRLIDIKGLKKDSIIEKMLEQKDFFKSIKMRKEMSSEEDEANLDKVQKSLDEVVKSYKKNQDESELKKNLKEIKKEAEALDLELLKGATIKKLETQIVGEHKLKKGEAPPKPSSKPMYKYDPVSKSLRLVPKPTEPKRKPPAPKKSEGTHEMPDGTVMSGSVHSEDSKPVKPKLKIVKKEKPKGTKLPKGVKDKSIKKVADKKEKEDLIKKTAESNLKGKDRKDELEQRLGSGDNIEVWDSDTGVLPSGSKTNKFSVFKRSWEAKGFKVIKKV
tara:strand:- start:553 stop:1497 length:945 start_codon:yes stop_codon:yes gene_type:complete